MAKGPTGLKEPGQLFQRYEFEVPAGVGIDAALDAAYWAHVGAHLRPCDRLTLIAQDVTWTAELIVLAAGSGFAKVKLLFAVDLTDAPGDEAEPEAEDALEVKYNGPSDRYVVIRKKDGVKLQTGFATKGEALAASANHQRLVTA